MCLRRCSQQFRRFELISCALSPQQQKELEELRAQLAKLRHVSEQLQAATTRAAAAETRSKAAEWDVEVCGDRTWICMPTVIV